MPDKPAKKRLVKNPESFRERAVKASSEQSTKKSYLKVALSPIVSILKSARKSIKKFFSAKAFKPFRRPAKIIGKILLPTYFRNSWKELKQVTWPNRTQSRQLTFAVIVFAVVFGAVIAGVDYGLDKIFRAILLK